MILVYTAFFTPVAIYFMRYFFLAIPRDLEEAAMVDGCTPLRRVRADRAARPPRPGLVATFVYAFLFAWDELLFVAALTQHNAETIPIGIRNFIGNYQERTAQLMAAGVVSTLPVLIAFFATQRWLVQGHHRRGGEGMTATATPRRARRRRVPAGLPLRRRHGGVPDRGRRARGRARRVDLGSLLPHARRRRQRRHRRRRLRPLPPLGAPTST